MFFWRYFMYAYSGGLVQREREREEGGREKEREGGREKEKGGRETDRQTDRDRVRQTETGWHAELERDRESQTKG